MNNSQAAQAGNQADEIIKRLATPGEAVATDKAIVDVLDQATPVEGQGDRGTTSPTDNWEKRYKGYRSSTDSTIHKLRQQVNQFDLVNNENAELKKRLEETQAQIPQTPDEMLELFSKEELDGFNKMFDGKLGQLNNTVSGLEEQLAIAKQEGRERIQNQEHRSVVQAVANAVPGYAEIDSDPAFKSWMEDVDAYGNVRYDLLIAAKASTPPDIDRIVSYYKEYSRIKGDKPPTQQELLQTPTSQAAPNNTQPQSLGIKWDQPTISQFYKDKATGKIDAKKAIEIEKDMYAYLGSRR